MAIIATLATVAVFSLGRGGQSPSGRAAADLAASLVLSARVEAMSFGHGSRLVIDNGNDPSRKLQRMGVFLRKQAGGPWEPAGRMVPLPQGSFFLPDYSTTANGTFSMQLPPANSGNTTVYVLEFDGSGHLINPQTATLVFGPNVMEASGNLLNPEQMLAARSGFKLRRNGRPLFLKSLDDMPKK